MNQRPNPMSSPLYRLGASLLFMGGMAAASLAQAIPSAPRDAIAVASGPDTIKVTWTDTSSNETGFEIERSPDDVSYAPIATVKRNTRTYSDTSWAAAGAKPLYYRVRAFSRDAFSDYSNVAVCSATVTPPDVPTAPNAPTGLAATALSSNAISLSWVDNSDNEAGFEVSFTRNGRKWTLLPRLGENTTQFTHIGLAPSSLYTYRVRAFNAVDGPWGTTASATTMAELPPYDLLSLTFSPPVVLGGEPVKGQINLTGFAPEGGVTVTITNTGSTAEMPASVFVPAGTASARFDITTAPVAASETVSIQAALNGVTQSADLTISPTPPPAGDRVLYVSPSGSDSAAGTFEAPWRTLSKAFAWLAPGDTLNVLGGTYAERVQFNFPDGMPDKRITVKAYPGSERPVLSGLLWITGADYWTFDGLNVTWNSAIGIRTDHMVKLTNGVGWSFKNAELWGAYSFAGLLVAGNVTGQPSDWNVSHNVIHDIYPSNGSNQDHCIYVNTGIAPGPGVIERNLLYNATNGEGIKLAGTDEFGASANIVARYNTIYNTAQSFLVGGLSHDIEIIGNLMGVTKSGYAHLRGYLLSGENNVARDNMGFAAGGMFLNDPGYRGIQDGGGNVFQDDPQFDPQFDSLTPEGFRPTNPDAQAYGHTAP